MLVGVIFSLLLSGPQFFPSPRPWRTGTRPAPGRFLGRAQKYRPHVCPRRVRGCPQGSTGQRCGWRPDPSGWRRWPSAHSGKGGARLGRGLRNPLACPADSSRVHATHPILYDRPHHRGFATGSPVWKRRDPRAGITHLCRHLSARAQFCP